ncbi:activator protein [Burkholderia mayonis]|uniref:Activator protein n=1 Tax=Burkholderia mayonis TaxID=1385591 RepID=A0A1B4FZF5_9BURK|nr:activator protein [Burkholderia mayonis]AOJ09060.1 activator protein [Burkholderia mayonis]KVE55862.1 activator protein [Burkholderia mayonis]
MRNRKFVPFVVVLAFAAAAATPALAVTVTRVDGQPMNPNGEPFSATSSPNETLLSKGSITANCVATFNGTITSAGVVNITSTTFAGSNSLCGLIKGSASGLNPWTGQADSATQLTINNAQVNVTLLGQCGPSKVVTSWNDVNSSITFSNAVLAPDCKVTGTVVTSPKFRVQ